MHDRFEKEVQKKMEDLNLSPSAPVWEKIKLEVMPEKKRRRAIFWVFFGLLILGGGYLTYEMFMPAEQTSHQSSTETFQKEETTPATSTAGNTKTTTSTGTASTTNIGSKTTVGEEPVKVGPVVINQTKHQKPGIIDTKEKELIHEKNTDAVITKVVKQKNTTNKKSINKNLLNVTLDKPVANITIIEQKEISTEIQNSKQQQPNNTATETKTPAENKTSMSEPVLVATATTGVHDSITKGTESIQSTATFNDTTTKKKVALDKKWKKQITVSIGSSGYASGSLFKSFAVNDAYAYAAAPSSVNSSGNLAGKPSQINNGFAFSVGFSFAKKLNAHLDLALGLQYAQYSTTMNVGAGNRNDTTIQSSTGSVRASQYYSNSNNSNEYTNRFHAIELPVTVSYKPFLQVPVLLSAGVSYGYLISTNALSYSSTSNLYYQDKDNYVHHLLPLFASIEAELFAKKKLSLRVGPSVQYNLLKLKKETTGDAQHLFFTGLKTSFIF